MAGNGFGLGEGGVFTTKFHTKSKSSNLQKTVIRSTEPPLLPSPCWWLVFWFF